MGRKATFAFIDNVELFLRTGTFPADASKNAKKVTRAASKRFTYKDGCLWRHFRGRLLQVARSEEEVREILTRYHDNNNHAGQVRAIKEIMMMYYWAGVTPAVKKWIKECSVCQSRTRPETQQPPVLSCLAYSCEANSYIDPDLTFHRFPKDAELRRKWLVLAQRDEGSLRTNSYLCSKHFDSSCFKETEKGQLTLVPGAVPTICSVAVKDNEVLVPSDDDILDSSTLEELLLACDTDTTDATEPAVGTSEAAAQLQEHQYCLPAPSPYSRSSQAARANVERKSTIDPSFVVYNQIARYLSHRVMPLLSKKNRGSFTRSAKRFSLIDGVLMYTRVTPPVRVPRNREEVDSILLQFHDNQGHVGQGICQRQITKHFYWRNLTRDLASWIASCHTCLNRTKRKWLRCSIYSCTNCCGPVERGLGLSFHRFPLHHPPMLAQWLKAVGRPNWHPRLRSSICSTHFTEDCFDRSGDRVVLYPDAVPTLFIHRDTSGSSKDAAPAGEEAYFAKFDAVELYLRRRVYPPGLSYVEKNTFRRFCKSFAIKDDELHMVKRDRVRLVLRSRQQVEVILNEYHTELNHLDVNKCLRLLNERFFWKTMRPDVMQWINMCSECNKKKINKPDKQTEPETLLQALMSPQRHEDDSDSLNDDLNYNHEEEDEGSEGGVTKETQPDTNLVETEVPACAAPSVTPVILHLKAPINSQARTSNNRFVARLVKAVNPSQSEDQNKTNCLDFQLRRQQTELQEDTPTEDQEEGSSCQGSARTHHCLPVQGGATPPSGGLKSKSKTLSQPRTSHRAQLLVKRKRDSQVGPSAKRSSGLEPVVAQSLKPWPVFTISSSVTAQLAKSTPEAHRKAPVQRSKKLQARTVIQQCTEAKVKLKPALSEADAQWAEIQAGMLVYVCFFDGATEDVTYEMANSLMTTRFFRKATGQAVSLLDLPGSVLFIPQDSLVGGPAPKKKVQFTGMCEQWWGAQLFSTLVSTCIDLMADSAKCRKAGVKVERGVYGQKQEIVFSSVEPLTLLLEF